MLPSNLPVVDDWTWPGPAAWSRARQRSLDLPKAEGPLTLPRRSLDDPEALSVEVGALPRTAVVKVESAEQRQHSVFDRRDFTLRRAQAWRSPRDVGRSMAAPFTPWQIRGG